MKEPRRASEVLQGKVIAFHVEYVHLTGSVTAALFLSQLVYWQGKGADGDGWIYKTAKEWTEETGLSRKEQGGARKKLIELGLIEERRKATAGAPIEYLLNKERFSELVDYVPIAQKVMCQKANSYVPIAQPYVPKGSSLQYTENTTKITTDIAAEFPELVEFMDRLKLLPGFKIDNKTLMKIRDKYKTLDLEEEAIKIESWLAQHPKRPCSQGFILNWLGKAGNDGNGKNYPGKNQGTALPAPNRFGEPDWVVGPDEL